MVLRDIQRTRNPLVVDYAAQDLQAIDYAARDLQAVDYAAYVDPSVGTVFDRMA